MNALAGRGTRLLLLCALTAAGACRDRRAPEPEPEPVDPTALDSARIGPVDSAESAFLQWWVDHARQVALRQPEPQPAAPVASSALFLLAGGDTLADRTSAGVLDLVHQGAELPGSPGTFRVYTFPESEQQLQVWVPEDGPACAQQQGALMLGDAPPARFPLNPFCQAAGVPYDVDGVRITTFSPRSDAPPWIEFTFDARPCAALHLFRWRADREAIELVHSIPTCNEVPRPQ